MENQVMQTIPESAGSKNLMMDVLKKHFEMMIRYPILSVIIVIITALEIYCFYQDNELLHGIAYAFAMYICMFVIDIWMKIFPPVVKDYPLVKQPKQESWIFILSAALCYLRLSYRFLFFKDWNTIAPWEKMMIFPFFLFMFPIALAVYFLIKKYRFKDLGLRFDRNMLLSLPIIFIVGITTWLVAPEKIAFRQMIHEEGFLNTLFLGFITAALSEEFFRYIGMSRLRLLFKSNGWGWFVPVLLWSLLHTPKWLGENPGHITGAFLGAATIIPLGLMWSYMIHRTKSIMPSILVHGSNLWGLQNGG